MEFKSWSDDGKKTISSHFLSFEENMLLNLLSRTYHSGFGYDLGEHVVEKHDILRNYNHDMVDDIISLSDNDEDDESTDSNSSKDNDKSGDKSKGADKFNYSDSTDKSDDEGGNLKEESSEESVEIDKENDSIDDENVEEDKDGEHEEDNEDEEEEDNEDDEEDNEEDEDESEDNGKMVIINLETAKNTGKEYLLRHKTIVLRLNTRENGSNWTSKPKKVKKTWFRDKEAKIAKFWYNLPKDKFESELRGQVEFVGPLSSRKYIHIIDTFEEIELRSDEKGSQLTIDDVLFACRGLCADDTRSVESFNVLSDNGSTLLLKANIDNFST